MTGQTRSGATGQCGATGGDRDCPVRKAVRNPAGPGPPLMGPHGGVQIFGAKSCKDTVKII